MPVSGVPVAIPANTTNNGSDSTTASHPTFVQAPGAAVWQSLKLPTAPADSHPTAKRIAQQLFTELATQI